MSFTAAKIGLQFDDCVTARSCKASQRASEQVAQTLGQEGALEESTREAILFFPFTSMHLAKVGGKASQFMAIGEHIGMWCHNLASGEQTGRGLAFDGSDGGFAGFLTSLFLEPYAQHFLLLSLDLAGLLCRDGGEQALDAIQRSIEIIRC